jgi:hypothetical protein
MKVGRNDPCPCGSGKKYKKCCLAKDEAAARQESAQRAATQREVAQAFDLPPLPAPPPPPEPPTPDPLDQARGELWETFEAAEPAEQPALFRRALAEGELLDAELAFEMVCAIRDHHDRAVFAEALDSLQTQRPELYQHDASYYLDWQIADALATGNQPGLPALGAALAETAGKDLDNFYAALERLAYHGQLDLIAQLMALAWPHVRTSDAFVPGADDEFAYNAMDLTLFARFEQNPDLSPTDPELLAELEAFAPIEPEKLAALLALLAGQPERRWTLDDFAFQPPARRGWDDKDEEEPAPAAVQLHDLTFTFLGALAREQGISLAKGDMARKSFERYILERHAGELEPRDSPFERMVRPKGRKTPSVVRRPQAHPLCPDRATFDSFLAGMLNIISPQHYYAAATLELTPAWLRFLEAHGLLTAEQRATALDELRGLVAEAAPIWKQRTGDPSVGRNIQLAWDRA